jgi:hypothetical protein
MTSSADDVDDVNDDVNDVDVAAKCPSGSRDDSICVARYGRQHAVGDGASDA